MSCDVKTVCMQILSLICKEKSRYKTAFKNQLRFTTIIKNCMQLLTQEKIKFLHF